MCLLFGAETMAADLAKEGTFTETFYGFGTFKGFPVGNTRNLSRFEQDGMHVGNGLMDHMTAHCFGTNDRMDDMRETSCNCVHTDPDGDQIVTDNRSNGKFPKDAKDLEGIAVMTTGTGKYAGISGSEKYTCHGSVFKAPTEETFFSSCTARAATNSRELLFVSLCKSPAAHTLSLCARKRG